MSGDRPEIAPATFLFAAVLAAGCGGETASDAFAAEPGHVIGGEGGPPLAGVRAARLLPGGRVAVVPGSPPELGVETVRLYRLDR